MENKYEDVSCSECGMQGIDDVFLFLLRNQNHSFVFLPGVCFKWTIIARG